MAPRWPASALHSSKAPRKLVFLFTLSLSVTYLFYSLLTCYSSLQFPLQEAGDFLQLDLLGSTRSSLQDLEVGPSSERAHSARHLSPSEGNNREGFGKLDSVSIDRLSTLDGYNTDKQDPLEGSIKGRFSSLDSSNFDQFSTLDSANVDHSIIPMNQLSSLQSSTLVRFRTLGSSDGGRFGTPVHQTRNLHGSITEKSFSTADSSVQERLPDTISTANSPLRKRQQGTISTEDSSEQTAQRLFSTTDSSVVERLQGTISTEDSSERTPQPRFSTEESAQRHPGERVTALGSQETLSVESDSAQSPIGGKPRFLPFTKDTFDASSSHSRLPKRSSRDMGPFISGAPTWGYANMASATGVSQEPEADHLEQELQEFSTTEEGIGPRAPPANSTPEYGEQKLPQAIIIGVKKGGTRALLEALRVHPDVRAVRVEPHFFDRNYEKGLEWYRSLMPNTLDGQITMEKTPSYFVTNEAPRRIHTMAKDIKLIIVVRNPITRAISDYTQTLSKRPEIPSFEVLAFKNRTLGLIDASWSALRIGIYALHLESWLRYFRLSQILFVSGERLISDPAGELDKVQDFLGLKRIVTEKHFYFNKTKGFPCLKNPEDSSAPRCLGKSKGRTHPTIEPEVIHRLHKFYKPFNAMFYQMTGQDFEWEREDLDK